MFNLDIILIIIIAANVVASLKGFDNYSFFEKYKFNIGAIKAGQHYRNITSGFLHADTAHLLFNMLTLYFFAPIVIGFLGRYNFLIVYMVSLLAGSLLSYYFHKNNNYYSAIGASGAVTGILYAAITMYPGIDLYLFFAIPIKGYIFGIAYLLYSIYGMKKSLGNIGHAAHFGGAVGGYAMTLILRPNVIMDNPLMTGLLFIPIVILFIMLKKQRI